MGLISHAETLADGEDRVRIVTQLANRVIARITEPELVQDDLKTLVRLAAQESNAQMKQYFLATVDALQEAIEDMNQDKP
jgi:hypothetical protein